MRLVNHARNAMDLRTTPAHRGPGSRAKPVEGFTWNPRALQAYRTAVVAAGAEGRIVTIFDGDRLGDPCESQPADDELAVCRNGSVTVTRDADAVPDQALLAPGAATINPGRVWHVSDTEEPTPTLSITAALDTDRHPRTDTRPTERVNRPNPEEAS
ncbi:cupin domain-containing protein [Streptomyces sp. NPDC055099]